MYLFIQQFQKSKTTAKLIKKNKIKKSRSNRF